MFKVGDGIEAYTPCVKNGNNATAVSMFPMFDAEPQPERNLQDLSAEFSSYSGAQDNQGQILALDFRLKSLQAFNLFLLLLLYYSRA